MIFFLHSALFVVLSSFNPASVIALLHASFLLRFGRPLLLFSGLSTSSVLLTMCSSFILLRWPYHFSPFSIFFLDACTTLVVPRMCSFRILSLLVTPHIHLSILISFTSSRASCPLVVAHVCDRTKPGFRLELLSNVKISHTVPWRVEHRINNRRTLGSNPTIGASKLGQHHFPHFLFHMSFGGDTKSLAP